MQNKLVTLGLVGVMGLVISGSLTGWFAKENHVSAKLNNDSENAVEEFRAYLKNVPLQDGGENQLQASLLEQAINRLQKLNLEASDSKWPALQGSINTQKGSINTQKAKDLSIDALTDDLNKLAEYRQELEEALVQVTTLDDFERLWQTRKDVEVMTQDQRKILSDKLVSHLRQALESSQEISASSAFQAVKNYTQQAASNEPAVRVLLSTYSWDDNDSVYNNLAKIQQSFEGVAEQTLENIEKQIQRQKQLLLGEKLQAVGPVKEGATGACNALLQQLAELQEMLQQADTESWQLIKALNPVVQARITTAKQASVDLKIDNSAVAQTRKVLFSESSSELFQLQKLAYNLWALREIDEAETSENWEEIVAAIEPAFLEPSVSAIYSQVYTRRLQEITDPEVRGKVVRILLSHKRISLTSF